MKDSVEMLLKRMAEDKSFAEKLLIQTDKEKIIEIAREEGIELTLENIDEANEIIAKVFHLQSEGELAEEELENVSGGGLTLTLLVSVSAISQEVTKVLTESAKHTVPSAIAVTNYAAAVSRSVVSALSVSKE